MEFCLRRKLTPDTFGAKPSTPFATGRSLEQRRKNSWPCSAQMETVSRTTSVAFTLSPSILAGSRGPSSQTEHGPNFVGKVGEQSRLKNIEPSSHPKKTPSAAHTTSCFTKPALPKLTRRI